MASGRVDLRSDTVTRPTDEMRRAMAAAEVGDDVYGEDPTVNRLEEAFAERVGMPAALYCPSGVMCNQIALRVLTGGAAGVVVAGARQHVVVYESGAAGRNAGVQFHTVDDSNGWFEADAVEWAADAAAHHHPRPVLVCVENTHMPANGAPWPLERLEAVAQAAERAGVPLYMDGARLFNAEVASGVAASRFCRAVTAVMACLSKGLSAPVGSVLAGDADFIAAARAERARMGGGMRQAGVVAAAGLVALETMVERLADDHRRATRLAEAVGERWPGSLDVGTVRTNIVTWRHERPAAVIEHFAAHDVLTGTIAPGVLRMVTHREVDDDGVEQALQAIATAP